MTGDFCEGFGFLLRLRVAGSGGSPSDVGVPGASVSGRQSPTAPDRRNLNRLFSGLAGGDVDGGDVDGSEGGGVCTGLGVGLGGGEGAQHLQETEKMVNQGGSCGRGGRGSEVRQHGGGVGKLGDV